MYVRFFYIIRMFFLKIFVFLCTVYSVYVLVFAYNILDEPRVTCLIELSFLFKVNFNLNPKD